MRTFRLTMFGLALALTGAASAQVELPPEVADGGTVTLEEIRANSRLVFDRLAGPAGGPIPRPRFLALELPGDVAAGGTDRALLQTVFEALDGDGNGSLARSEWSEAIDRELGFADADGDSRITLEELAAARRNLGLGDALGIVF